MEILSISFRAVFPIFVYMAVGYLLRALKVVDIATLRKMNRVAFLVFLTTKIFYNVYSADLGEVFAPKLVLFVAVCVLALFFLAYLIIPRVEKENPNRSVLIQAIYRSNYAIYGTELAYSVYGNTALELASGMSAVAVGLYNILAVTTFEIFRGRRPKVKDLILRVLRSPLIVAIILGSLVNLSGLHFPEIVDTTIHTFGNVTTPVMFMILGGMLQFGDFRKYRKKLITVTLVRMLVVPAVFLTLGVLAGFRNAELMMVLAVFATPMAIATFAMASNMGGNAELAGDLIALTSVVSVVTIFLWITLLKMLGYM